MIKLWQKDLALSLIKFFLSFFLGIYLIFCCIDLSTNGVAYLLRNAKIGEFTLYYLQQLVHFLDLFLPLSFLLSTIVVLTQKSTRQELTALQMAGISKKKIALPFYFFAALLFFLSLVNYQWILPKATIAMENFQVKYAKHPERKKGNMLFSSLLPDGSKMVFTKKEDNLEDVYWIRSFDEIWHFTTLDIEKSLAFFADKYVRGEQGIVKEAFFSEYKLPFSPAFLKNISLPPQQRSLFSLAKQSLLQTFPSLREKASVLSHLHQKLSSSFLSFLILFALFPFCTNFERKKKIFLLFAMSLFFFVCFRMITDAVMIFAENNAYSPSTLLWMPYLLSFFFLSFFYIPKREFEKVLCYEKK